MIVAENLFFWTEADLKSNTPHELYSVITELRIADLSLMKKGASASRLSDDPKSNT